MSKPKLRMSLGVIGLLVVILVMSGCMTTREVEKSKVALILSDLSNPFFVSLQKGAEKEASIKGIELLVSDAQNDSKKELDLVKKAIDAGAKLVIINPTDSDAVFQAVQYANEKKIPVITVDRASNGGSVICHIASDNRHGGELAAKLMIQLSGNKGEYVEMKGIQGTSAAVSRGEGFNTYMHDSGSMTLAAAVVADFNRAKGKAEMEKVLKVHPDLVAVFAHNDEMALGALEAIEAAGLKMAVIGFDGTAEALDAVEAGTLAGTVVQQPEEMGSQAVEEAALALKGSDVPAEVLVDVKLIQK